MRDRFTQPIVAVRDVPRAAVRRHGARGWMAGLVLVLAACGGPAVGSHSPAAGGSPAGPSVRPRGRDRVSRHGHRLRRIPERIAWRICERRRRDSHPIGRGRGHIDPAAQPFTLPRRNVARVRDLDGMGTGPLAAGRYTRSTFAPPVTFTIGPGWSAVQASSGFFDVERNPDTLDVIAVQFARPSDVHSANAAVSDLIERDDLVVGNPVEVSVGGQVGLRMQIDATNPDLSARQLTAVFSVPDGTVSLASGRRLQVTFVDTADGLLAILVGGSVRQWDAATAAAGPVTASITIGGS